MDNILINQSLTETTVISFIQNRLREFKIENIKIETGLYGAAKNIAQLIKVHFQQSHLLTSEEDIYFDEIISICKELITELSLIKSSLAKSDFILLVFILIKVLDQIVFESKNKQIEALTLAILQTEKKILELVF
jgi:hypothetical protein